MGPCRDPETAGQKEGAERQPREKSEEERTQLPVVAVRPDIVESREDRRRDQDRHLPA